MTSAATAYQSRDAAVSPEAARRWRLAYVVSHPIQYQAPLLRFIAAQPDIDLTVFFQSDSALRGQFDPGFGRVVQWDVPLLNGYRHEFLPALGRRDVISGQLPLSYGIGARLRRGAFDAVWVHGYARAFNWQAMLAAKMAGLKVFVRDDVTEAGKERGWARRAAKQVFCRVLAQIADGFLATGTANADYYRANGIPARQIFLLPYAVDNAFFAALAAEAAPNRERLRASLGLEPGRPIILFVAKFQAVKRPNDLLRAYERVAKVTGEKPPYLLFIGEGVMRPALEAEVAVRGLTGVRFLGFRNQTELPAFFDLCDVFVLPSGGDRWGLVVNEAMAVGRAVVVTDKVGCAPDLVKPGVNGFAVGTGDIRALAEALRDITRSPERSRTMGAASREIIGKWSFREDIEGLRRALEATANARRRP
jgi:glycosyltransferase involved in cell wall biosynthesis